MSSPHVDDLVRALRWRGVEVQTEFPDGSKHVDICVPALRLFIEVDGSQHYTNADQFEADLKRDFYSYKEGTLQSASQTISSIISARRLPMLLLCW
jgi:very-short-patch-repair endonuclease